MLQREACSLSGHRSLGDSEAGHSSIGVWQPFARVLSHCWEVCASVHLCLSERGSARINTLVLKGMCTHKQVYATVWCVRRLVFVPACRHDAISCPRPKNSRQPTAASAAVGGQLDLARMDRPCKGLCKGQADGLYICLAGGALRVPGVTEERIG